MYEKLKTKVDLRITYFRSKLFIDVEVFFLKICLVFEHIKDNIDCIAQKHLMTNMKVGRTNFIDCAQVQGAKPTDEG